MRPLLTILALACVACGPSERSERRDDPATPAARAETQAPAPSPTPPAPMARPAPTARPAPPDRAVVAAHRAELATARALVTRGDLAGAVRAFDALIERTAGSARIDCEAGYVNHRAGDDVKARRLIDEGLERFGRLDTSRAEMLRAHAMCLYNSGLVHEAAGAPSDAARDYVASLALRPSPIVQRRFDALPEAIRSADRSPAIERPGDDGEWEVVADLASAIEMAERVVCRDNPEMADDCVATGGERVVGVQRSFQLVTVAGSCCGGMSSTWVTLLFVEEEGRFRYVDDLATLYDMGGFTSVAGGVRDLRAVQLVPGGPSEVAFEVAIGETDTEDGYCESSSHRVGLCIDVAGALTCRAYTVEEREICHESWQEYEDDEESTAEPPGSIRVLESGRIRVEGRLCLPAGEYDAEALFRRDDCGFSGDP